MVPTASPDHRIVTRVVRPTIGLTAGGQFYCEDFVLRANQRSQFDILRSLRAVHVSDSVEPTATVATAAGPVGIARSRVGDWEKPAREACFLLPCGRFQPAPAHARRLQAADCAVPHPDRGCPPRPARCPGAGIVTLDEIAVLSVHDAHERGEVRSGRWMEGGAEYASTANPLQPDADSQTARAPFIL